MGEEEKLEGVLGAPTGIQLTEVPENESDTARAIQQIEDVGKQTKKIMNFATGEEMDNLSDEDYSGWLRANEGLASAYKLYQDDPNADAWAVRSVMGDNYGDFAKRYGGSTKADATARDIFMVRPRSTVLNSARSLADKYGEYLTSQKDTEEQKERAAIEERNNAALKFKSDDGFEVDIPREATNFFRQKKKELAVASDAEKAAILKEIQGELSTLTGGRIPAPTDKDAPMTSYKDVLLKAQNPADRLLADDIMDAAINRVDEQYVPKTDDVDVLEKFRERMERQYLLEKEKEERRLARERLGYGLADFAAVIGDTIRAKTGAPVNPRDWQQIYDNLTAQERANVNNYQVRMQKLHDDIRAERMAKAQAAAAAREKALDRALKVGEAQKDRDLKWDIANLKDKQNRYYAFLRWGQGGKDDKSKTHELLMIGDKAMLVRKGQSFTNTINSIYNLLDKQSSYKPNSSSASISLLEGSPELNEEPQQFFNRTIQIVLSSHWDDLTKDAQDAIIKKLLAMQGEWITGGPVQKKSADNDEDTANANVKTEEEDDDEIEDRLG